MERPRLGQWCIISNEAQKSRRYITNNSHYVHWQKRYRGWKPEPFNAMYIGYRIKYEGKYWEEGIRENWSQCFTPDKSIEVWIFVAGERNNPMAVFPEDVEYMKGLQS